MASGHWALDLLIDQLFDSHESIVQETVAIIDEALEDKVSPK
jgi:hypothetical protein